LGCILLPFEHQAPILARAEIEARALESAAERLVTVEGPCGADLGKISRRKNPLNDPSRVGSEIGFSQWTVPKERRQGLYQGLCGRAPSRCRLRASGNEANLEPGAEGGPDPSQRIQFEAIPSGGEKEGPVGVARLESEVELLRPRTGAQCVVTLAAPTGTIRHKATPGGAAGFVESSEGEARIVPTVPR